MCVMFSQLQNLSPWSEGKPRIWIEAKDHMEFLCEIYAEQARCHRWFVHEHSAEATSWNLEVVRPIWEKDGVEAAVADQCICGLFTWGKNGKVMPARRGTEFMTNCPVTSTELQIRCDGSHEHQRLLGGRAKQAHRYPKGLCRAMCAGLVQAIRNLAMELN